jgi:hypothetical protein
MNDDTKIYFEIIKKWKIKLIEFDLLYYEKFTTEQFFNLIDLFDMEMPEFSVMKSSGNGSKNKLIKLQLSKVADNYIEFRNKLQRMENEFFKSISPGKSDSVQ